MCADITQKKRVRNRFMDDNNKCNWTYLIYCWYNR